jgi:hypothetical protein
MKTAASNPFYTVDIININAEGTPSGIHRSSPTEDEEEELEAYSKGPKSDSATFRKTFLNFSSLPLLLSLIEELLPLKGSKIFKTSPQS